MTSLFHQLIVLEEIVDQAIKHYTLNVRSRGKQLVLFSQCLQILFMSRVTMTSASQILESFWNIWSQELPSSCFLVQYDSLILMI